MVIPLTALCYDVLDKPRHSHFLNKVLSELKGHFASSFVSEWNVESPLDCFVFKVFYIKQARLRVPCPKICELSPYYYNSICWSWDIKDVSRSALHLPLPLEYKYPSTGFNI
jgi:hypothetical protein